TDAVGRHLGVECFMTSDEFAVTREDGLFAIYGCAWPMGAQSSRHAAEFGCLKQSGDALCSGSLVRS
ncbi:hypothetical protein, partial [Klebsiella pneumoniae]|uniref:hypothetical protein n=1 Tax=Klebsiella pneumoniae TaxID=573 RepID=UPI00371B90B9